MIQAPHKGADPTLSTFVIDKHSAILSGMVPFSLVVEAAPAAAMKTRPTAQLSLCLGIEYPPSTLLSKRLSPLPPHTRTPRSLICYVPKGMQML